MADKNWGDIVKNTFDVYGTRYSPITEKTLDKVQYDKFIAILLEQVNDSATTREFDKRVFELITDSERQNDFVRLHWQFKSDQPAGHKLRPEHYAFLARFYNCALQWFETTTPGFSDDPNALSLPK